MAQTCGFCADSACALGARLGESQAMALCPLCFVPSLPDDGQDMVKQGNGLAWMWFGWPLKASSCSFMWEGESEASKQSCL